MRLTFAVVAAVPSTSARAAGDGRIAVFTAAGYSVTATGPVRCNRTVEV